MHFFFEIAIGKRLLDTGNNRMLVAQVFRADPIEGKVGKRRLRTPAGRNVQVINQFLKSLLDLLVRKVIGADVRRQIGIDRRKGLSTGPFILQRAHEVDHLADGCRQMFGRTGFGLAGNAVETFMQQIFQRPTGTIGGQHIQIVNVNVTVAVRFADFGRINMTQPVVGGNLAGNVQNQAAVGITLVGIGIDAPVEFFQIFVD